MSLNLKRWATALTLATGLVGLTQVARADLLGYWDFNTENPVEKTVALDQSGKGNHGKILGDAEYTADKGGYSGKAGDRALTFDGSNDSVFLQRSVAGFFDTIADNQKLTISFWQYGSEDQPRNQSAFWGDIEANRSFQAHVPWSDSTVYFDTGGCCSGAQRLNGPADPSTFAGAWNHWVFIKDGGRKEIYVNGDLFLEDAEADQVAPMTRPRGGLWLGSGPGNNFSKGEYDEFAIWDEGLSAAQVTTLYNQGVRGLEAGLPTVTTYTPGTPAGRLEKGANNKVVGAAYIADGPGGNATADIPTWRMSRVYERTLTPAGTENAPGLATEWFFGPNWGSASAWTANTPAPGVYGNTNAVPDYPAFRVDEISWGGNKIVGGTAEISYPAQTGWTVNYDNYSARFTGEIFVPAGTWTFRDHNDDYASLTIDGKTLIDDNTWTSFDGQGDTANPGTNTGGVASFTSALADQDHMGMKGHWYSIDFRGAEGGGGDNFRLLWDYSGANQNPADDASVEFPDFNTVDGNFFRSKLPGVKLQYEVPLGSLELGLGAAGYSKVGDQTNDGDFGYTLAAGETQLLRLYVNDTVLGRESYTEVSLTGDAGGTSGLAGDVNNDGKVDLTDFGILKANFGKSAAAGAPVPEPSTFLLAGLGLLGLALRTGFRRWKR